MNTSSSATNTQSQSESRRKPLCTLRVGSEVFGIDTADVQEILREARPQAVPRAPEFVAGVLAYRGEVLLAISLPALLGQPPAPRVPSAVVMKDSESGEIFALLVDAVADVLDVDPNLWEANPPTIDDRRKAIFCGVYRMEQSHIVRLEPAQLQPSRLAQLFEAERGQR